MADPKVRVRFTAKDETGPALTGLRAKIARLQGLARTFGAAMAAVGAGLGIREAIRYLRDATAAADAFEASQRKLSATSKLTGVTMGAVSDLHRRAQRDFLLSSEAAADWTQNAIKMATAAGDANRAGEVLTAWLDLAAAQGLDAATALQTLQTTLIGQDEGLNRLGLANPQQLYEKWADAAGLSAAKLTEAQKAQAILSAVTASAAKVQGEYARSLDTSAGRSQRASMASRDLAIEVGNTLRPLRDAGSAAVELAATNLTEFLRDTRREFELIVRPIGAFAAAFLEPLRILREFNKEWTTALRRRAVDLLGSRGADFLLGGIGRHADFSGVAGGSGSTDIAGRLVRDPRGTTLDDIVVTTDKERLKAAEAARKAREKLLADTITDARLTAIPSADVSLTQGRLDQQGVRTGGIEAAGAPLGEALSGLTDQDVWAEVLQPWDSLLEKLDTTEKKMAYLGAVTLLQFANAWTASWEAIGGGANVLEESGKFVKNMLADVAKTKAQMEVAEGVKALADGTWPPNPLAIAAAGKHFAAAALFSLVAGAVGGRGGSRGGGAGGGAVSGNDAIRDQRDLQAARGTTTVVLRKGYINPRDPDFQDFLADAITNAAGRRVEIVVE